MWKFHDFSITQILREIKSAISTHLEALNFDFNEFLHFFNAEIYQVNKIQSPKNGKNGNFYMISRFSKFDFTENLNDRKSSNFHTVSFQIVLFTIH